MPYKPVQITEAETPYGVVKVFRTSEAFERCTYGVEQNGVMRHPNCSAEDVMRALSHYLSGVSFKLKEK